MKRALIWGTAVVLLGALGWTAAELRSESNGPQPVIADYSPTVSDVGGLMYLLLNPDVEVIAITLPTTGEAGCELGIEVTLGILALLDQEDIPVACGDAVPDGAREWPPAFLSAHENLRFSLPASTASASPLPAPDLIAEAAAGADRPAVIWAVAPLTNVAAALDRHPGLADHLDRIVVMGGAVDAGGNVEEAIQAEWNVWIDVAAAGAVVRAGVPIVMVPLDATNDAPVPVWYRSVLQDSEQSDAIVYLTKLVRIFPQVTSGFFYLWDELAAAVVVEPDLVTFEQMEVLVVQSGSDLGHTRRAAEGGATIWVATGVPDPTAFYTEFLGTLSGGTVPLRSATSEEAEYLFAVQAIFAAAQTKAEPSLEIVFGAEEFDGPVVSEQMGLVFEIMDEAVRAMEALDPPGSLQEAATGYEMGLASTLAARDGFLDAIADADSWEELDALFADLTLTAACAPLVEQAALLGVDLSSLPC